MLQGEKQCTERVRVSKRGREGGRGEGGRGRTLNRGEENWERRVIWGKEGREE